MFSFDQKSRFAFAGTLFFSGACPAVFLNPDGLGQALIYPYYTVRSVDGNAFNTYVAIANRDERAKALRVRFREGTNGREVAGFNLFLGAGDMWTAALVSDGDGARLISADRSCTEPALASVGTGLVEMLLSSAAYSGPAADGLGEGRDRTREGFVEVIEMASIAPGSQAESAAGFLDRDCGHFRQTAAAADVAASMRAPAGRLLGSLTLINVASGHDFTLNAQALASLSTQPFFRPAGDPYPDFDSVEVAPVSTLLLDERSYRLQWSRAIDAVSSVLMQSATMNEYVLDTAAASRTDWILTFPTRHKYVGPTTSAPPFTREVPEPCEMARQVAVDREGREPAACGTFETGNCPEPVRLCAASVAWSFRNGSPHVGPLFGSANPPRSLGTITRTFENGWASTMFTSAGALGTGLVSLANSAVTDLGSGTTTTGSFRVLGLPVVGFMARTFNNGTLSCIAGECQGNYGSAFPHQPVRSIVTAP